MTTRLPYRILFALALLCNGGIDAYALSSSPRPVASGSTAALTAVALEHRCCHIQVAARPSGARGRAMRGHPEAGFADRVDIASLRARGSGVPIVSNPSFRALAFGSSRS